MQDRSSKGDSLLIGIAVVTLLLMLLIGRLILSTNARLIAGEGYGLNGFGALSTLPILLLSGLLIALIMRFVRTVSQDDDVESPLYSKQNMRTIVVILIAFFFGMLIQPWLNIDLGFLPTRFFGGLVFLIPLVLIGLLISTHLREVRR